MDNKTLQQNLNQLGYGPLAVDGIVGEKTLAALKVFLHDNGYESPQYPETIEKIMAAKLVSNKLNPIFHKSPVSLDRKQFYQVEYPKKHIFLHHTAGGNVEGAIEWWNSKPDHIATPYIIGRDGRIYELFDPRYWSYALGLKGGTEIEKASVQIEIVAWGKLSKKGDKFYSSEGSLIPNEDVITFKDMYRDCYYYHKYTQAQLDSLKLLLPYLVHKFDIKVQPLTNFWWYNKDWVLNPKEGIWSHSTVRPDKSDIMPQKELITLLYTLFP
jgi:peptidoglycan hydrolase-like protein with peptidoglycan-binding domain